MYGLCSLDSIVHTSWAPESLYTDFCIRVQSGARLFILVHINGLIFCTYVCTDSTRTRVQSGTRLHILVYMKGSRFHKYIFTDFGARSQLYIQPGLQKVYMYTCTIRSPTPHSGAYKWSHILYICMYRLNTNTRTIWNPTPHFCVYKGFQIS